MFEPGWECSTHLARWSSSSTLMRLYLSLLTSLFTSPSSWCCMQWQYIVILYIFVQGPWAAAKLNCFIVSGCCAPRANSGSFAWPSLTIKSFSIQWLLATILHSLPSQLPLLFFFFFLFVFSFLFFSLSESTLLVIIYQKLIVIIYNNEKITNKWKVIGQNFTIFKYILIFMVSIINGGLISNVWNMVQYIRVPYICTWVLHVNEWNPHVWLNTF